MEVPIITNVNMAKRSISSLLIIGFISVSVSYLKFSFCLNDDFSGLTATAKGCYSDIPIFWNTHLLEAHVWPYQFLQLTEINQTINPVEYPLLTGVIMWLLSFVTPLSGNTDGNFFLVNTFFIGALFISTLIVLNNLKKGSYIYFAAAPAVIFSLLINWDMWVVFFLILSLILYDKKRFTKSALALSIAISFKFFPIVLLLGIVIIGVRNKAIKSSGIYISKTILFFTLINLPAAIKDFDGWFYFYKLSADRDIGSGSIWEILELSGFNVEGSNSLYVVLTLLLFILISVYLIKFAQTSELNQMAYLLVFGFLLFNKVYSPQFVIWLTCLAVLVIQTKPQRILFVFWQGFELAYHFAIWRYLFWQGYGNQVEGLSPDAYKWVSLLRLLSMVIFTISLIWPQISKSIQIKKGVGGDERI
jgi:uncharacterized membrane protein